VWWSRVVIKAILVASKGFPDGLLGVPHTSRILLQSYASKQITPTLDGVGVICCGGLRLAGDRC
jgi:hypothetical protein